MKQIYIILSVFAIITLMSCDKNFDRLAEPDEFQTAPSVVSNVTSEALPGQIELNWEVPADKNFYFLRISYYDHLTKTDKSVLASNGTTSIVVDDTRARYGDYEFKFQTFNRKNQGSEVMTVKARSGAAPITETITRKKVELNEAQLSTKHQEPSEGPIKNLIDGNVNTFFHTRWSSPQQPMPHDIQINLNEPLENFQFYTQNRNGSQEAPAVVEVQISNDGTNWETIETIEAGIPSGGSAEYTSAVFRPGKTFRHFRYNVLRTQNSRNYFNLAEFALYDVTINIYNPETDEKE